MKSTQTYTGGSAAWGMECKRPSPQPTRPLRFELPCHQVQVFLPSSVLDSANADNAAKGFLSTDQVAPGFGGFSTPLDNRNLFHETCLWYCLIVFL
jgi:hypothetical protein